jgi:hypothetical protein
MGDAARTFFDHPERFCNRPRPEFESAVSAHFGKLQPDGSAPRLLTLHAYGRKGKTRQTVDCAIPTIVPTKSRSPAFYSSVNYRRP